VVVALAIGTVELLQVLSARLSLGGGFWTWIDNLNFGSLGYLIVALFVLMWTASFAIWKLRRIEDRWGELLVAEEPTRR
jgi:high-affinity nickel-transport protein